MLKIVCAAVAAVLIAGAAEAQETSCTADIGADQAQVLVDRCIRVSPATHPPCNAQNTCKMITDEIKRSCKILGYNAPGFCDEYR